MTRPPDAELAHNTALIEDPAEFAREHHAASWLYLNGEEFAAMEGEHLETLARRYHTEIPEPSAEFQVERAAIYAGLENRPEDPANLIRIVQEVRPDEIYNLAAQSHVKVSFDTPEYTANADGIGTLRGVVAKRYPDAEIAIAEPRRPLLARLGLAGTTTRSGDFLVEGLAALEERARWSRFGL